MSLNVLVVGGSRNIGYHSAIRLLAQGSSVTFLLRSPAVFDDDATIQEHVMSGKARLVKGDALNTEDVKTVWAEAGKDRPVDLLLFTLGFTGKPVFHPLKGFLITPPNLVTQSLLNLLCEMPQTSAPHPKIIFISTSGVSPTSRKQVPLLLKPLYGYVISRPLRDKLGAERVIAYCAGWEWAAGADGEPGDEIMGRGWRKREGLPVPGSLTNAIVLRPALLTDGECLADAAAAVGEGKALPYRSGPGEVVGYTVSRKDVAHFVVEGILKDWAQWGNQQISIAY